MRKLIFIFFSVFITMTACPGCGKTERDEPTKYVSQERLARMQQQQIPIRHVSNNPAFFVSRDTGARAPEVKDLDGAMRPVLKKLFGDAKIIAESTAPEKKIDGEVVENRITYATKQILTLQNGQELHTVLHNAGFGLSPRLGGKPSVGHTNVVMSLFKNTSQRSYSLVINVDTKKQQIVVESYQLGSRYDHL